MTGAVLPQALRQPFSLVQPAFAGPVDRGDKVAEAVCVTVKTVKAESDQARFAVEPRYWGHQAFQAWINHNSRFAKDLEATIASAMVLLYVSSTMLFDSLLKIRSLIPPTSQTRRARTIFETDRFAIINHLNGIDGGRYKDRTCDPYDVKVQNQPYFTHFQELSRAFTNVRGRTETEQDASCLHTACTTFQTNAPYHT